jgi:nucleotide-binding universal stress UspA family protein
MQKLFNRILVPVDLTEKSRKAVEKAVELAKEYSCTIHLVHVTKAVSIGSLSFDKHGEQQDRLRSDERQSRARLMDLFGFLKPVLDPSIKVEYSVLRGNWNEAIVNYVNEHGVDLVLVGQGGHLFSKKEMLLNPNRIATRTNVPVITVPSNRRLVKLYSIVIPVTDFLPVRKLIYGIYMGTKHATTVKLLGIENPQTSEKVRHYMRKAYQLIRDNCSLNVELELLPGENVAETVNQYAMTHSADLVIVNPGGQSRMPGFFSWLFGKIIQRYSAPPVLTVSPV